MSDEMKAEVDRLKAENAKLAEANTKLTGDLAGLADELKETRHEARDRRHEAKTLAHQVEALTKERDDFRIRAEADPEDLRKQFADAQAVVRSLKHERAFEKVARELKVGDPAKFTDLVKLAGYEPQGDEPDESKIAESFQGALKGRPWLLDAEKAPPAPGGATTAPGGATVIPTVTEPAKPGPGADRGQSVTSPTSQPAQRPAGRL